jgi:hypothetical protein
MSEEEGILKEIIGYLKRPIGNDDITIINKHVVKLDISDQGLKNVPEGVFELRELKRLVEKNGLSKKRQNRFRDE